MINQIYQLAAHPMIARFHWKRTRWPLSIYHWS